jgi:hypothetical protein
MPNQDTAPPNASAQATPEPATPIVGKRLNELEVMIKMLFRRLDELETRLNYIRRETGAY